LKTTEPALKVKCSSSQTETSEILKSYSHFKIHHITFVSVSH